MSKRAMMLTRSAPLFAPVEVNKSSGNPSNWPPTLPPLRRNSSMLRSLKARSEAIAASAICPSCQVFSRLGGSPVVRQEFAVEGDDDAVTGRVRLLVQADAEVD